MKIKTAEHPVHKILVPSLNRELRFRPFVMKENKALMLAQMTEDTSVVLTTLAEVVASCCLDGIKAEDLSVFDYEYILCHLRSISVGNKVTLVLKCDGESQAHDADEETRESRVVLDLETVKVKGLEDFSLEVKLSDTLMVKMKMPTLIEFQKYSEIPIEDGNVFDRGIKICAMQMDKIYTEEEVIDCKEHTEEEIIEWLEELPLEQYEVLSDWFNRIPECEITVEWKCPHCGKHNVRSLKGIMDFFG